MTEEKPKDVELVFEKCPACGSTRRMVAERLQQLRDEKRIEANFMKDGLQQQVPLMDQGRVQRGAMLDPIMFKVPVMVLSWDVCECGTMYCTKLQIVMVKPKVMMVGQPGRRVAG
ncbi:MAG: hypothetical protein PHQ43_00080 [Dehalococcoidales bacterium]|nr:hypothetical protein [Dehalococcoidales bacterium]